MRIGVRLVCGLDVGVDHARMLARFAGYFIRNVLDVYLLILVDEVHGALGLTGHWALRRFCALRLVLALHPVSFTDVAVGHDGLVVEHGAGDVLVLAGAWLGVARDVATIVPGSLGILRLAQSETVSVCAAADNGLLMLPAAGAAGVELEIRTILQDFEAVAHRLLLGALVVIVLVRDVLAASTISVVCIVLVVVLVVVSTADVLVVDDALIVLGLAAARLVILTILPFVLGSRVVRLLVCATASDVVVEHLRLVMIVALVSVVVVLLILVLFLVLLGPVLVLTLLVIHFLQLTNKINVQCRSICSAINY